MPQLIDPEGRLTPAAVTQFTEGDCWLLAHRLGRLLNAPLIAVVDPTDPDEWHHVAVDLGRETLLDALGAKTRAETLRYWSESLKETVVLRELGRFHTLDELLGVLDATELAGFVSVTDESAADTIAKLLASTYL